MDTEIEGGRLPVSLRALGVDVRLAPGHTPGSSIVALSDGAARAMLLGVMVHCPLELS